LPSVMTPKIASSHQGPAVNVSLPIQLRPTKHRAAQIDHRDIKAHQRVLETELPLLWSSWLTGSQGLTLRGH
jgi:hypothetical protein